MKQGKFNIVIGAQAGSESKGKLSGWLCDTERPDALVMASSPNAGHTVITPTGEKKVSYHLPIGSVMCDSPIYLGPSSVINLFNLAAEIESLGIAPDRITIDPRAATIHEHHIYLERNNKLSDIGSTLQGIGECRIHKLRRNDKSLAIYHDKKVIETRLGVHIAPTSPTINNIMSQGGTVLCESTQGFDLDLEHGIDPIYCTSKMVNPAMCMAEAGVSPALVGDVYGVLRPYPIRVNNRTGTSGPYTGSPEITWEIVASRCGHPHSGTLKEITTTTKLPRRVFEFSDARFEKFVQICRPTSLCLQFANYIDWSAYGVRTFTDLPSPVVEWIKDLQRRYMVPVDFIGTGPQHNDMVIVPKEEAY